MRLRHVCTGKTQEVDIRGQKVTTAYLKECVSGPQVVCKNGLKGNEVAVHTDAVYAIAAEHYDYWASHLGEDSGGWPTGYFAENLGIEGLDEKSLRVGDVVAIGNEVRLSVSGPRVPCFKLCWRLGQPDTFIREFALSGRSGVYFNVEQTGTIQAGDKVRIVRRADDSVGILELSEIIFAERKIDETKLRHILNLEGLSETTALLLGNKLYQIVDLNQTKQNRWEDWREFRVDNIFDEALGIKSFVLKPADGKTIAPFRAGQFLTVELQDNSADPMIRVWSLSDFDPEPETYRVSIKREPSSRGGSSYMHESVSKGDTLRIKPPLGHFVLDRSSFKPVLLVAGGIGITPLLAMARAHLDRGAKAPPLYLIHCCQNLERQPFREELDELAENSGVKLLHVYNQPGDNDTIGKDYDLKGYLSLSDIVEFMADCHIVHGGKEIAMPWFDCDIYVCGPPIFQEKLVAAMLADGANKARIFTETFSAGTDSTPLNHSVEQAEVTFSASDLCVTWRADEGVTLLELAEANGMRPGNACRMGVCQTCSARLLKGEVVYQINLSHKPPDGQVLLCSAIPASNHVTIEL